MGYVIAAYGFSFAMLALLLFYSIYGYNSAVGKLKLVEKLKDEKMAKSARRH